MSQNKKSIELLAPVGTPDSFHAALDAGADAVYLGFGAFNARQRSKNFTPESLSHLIPYAQEQGKKVYVALNTLVKDGEIPAFVEDCNTLKQLKPDAVIVQDLGMVALMKKYYPNIELHGSTQMSIHNSAGFEAAEKLGLTRVVPARELTLQEIRKINNKTNLEIELFVHGALCYSVSGNCLASSFIGGSSGNRGKCTQVCRRSFSEGSKSGLYFSPKDFWAIDFIDEYRNIGIKSLKIEGRMKGPEYTYEVTSAYREFIDGTIDVDTAKERLSHDFGRKKCSFLLPGTESVGVVSAGQVGGTGNYAGKVMGMMRNEITVDLSGDPVEIGDRVRFQAKDSSSSEVAKVRAFRETDSMRTIEFSDTEGFARDGSIFIVGRKNSKLKEWRKRKVDTEPRRLKKRKGVATGRVMAPLDALKTGPTSRQQLYLRFDSLKWLKIAARRKDARLILNVDAKMDIDLTEAKMIKHVGRLICALPIFIPETELNFWRDRIDQLRKQGVQQFMIGQFGFKELFKKGDILHADYQIWTTNRWTEKMLLEEGFATVMYSPEDDIMNLKRIGSSKGLMPIYMRIPLFLSRVNSPVQDNKELVDDRDVHYFSSNKYGLSNLISKQAIGLTHRISKLQEYGVSKFVVDFSWYKEGPTLFADVLRNYDKQERVPGSVLFNHKSGLL